MSERFIPEEYYDGHLKYCVTIIAGGGNLEQLITSLKQNYPFSDAEKKIPLTCSFVSYMARKSDNGVSFDVYCRSEKPLKSQLTSTALFRSKLGELVTLLLQTGYTISAQEIPTMRQKSEYPFCF